jgi:hypothetical protein
MLHPNQGTGILAAVCGSGGGGGGGGGTYISSPHVTTSYGMWGGAVGTRQNNDRIHDIICRFVPGDPGRKN